MKNAVFSYYNLTEDAIKKIERALETKLIEYSIGIIPTLLFCNEEEYLDELFLEYMFNNHVIIIRISENSNNSLVFLINDSLVDAYNYDPNLKEYHKYNINNMELFKNKIEKILTLNVTPAFSDIPNSINILKHLDYINSMVDYVEYLNMSEVGHSIRVAQYSKMLASGINYENYNNIYLAGLLHDIGKLMISNSIKLEKGNLNDNQVAQLKKHPKYSCNLLNKNLYLPVRDIILYHHERCDSSGYPYGIKNIPLGSRILAIADSYDAMTSSRIYTNFKTKEDALNELKICAEKGLYDKYLVDKFVEILTNK